MRVGINAKVKQLRPKPGNLCVEIEAIRRGEHGARSTKQAIAIGLSKAHRAGVKLPAPAKGKAPEEMRKKAKRDLEKAENGSAQRPSQKRSRATLKALKREGRSAASKDRTFKAGSRRGAGIALLPNARRPRRRPLAHARHSTPASSSVHEPPACFNAEFAENDYDKAFEVIVGGKTYVFDSFECAIHAPSAQLFLLRVPHHRPRGRGEWPDFCCVPCARPMGALL